MSPTQADQSGAVGTKSGLPGPSDDLRGTQKGHFGPKRALLGPPGAQKGPDTRSKCRVSISLTQTGQICPPGALRGPPVPLKGILGPKQALLGAPESLRVPWGACFWPNCHWLVQRDDPHPYHVLGPLNGPLWHFWGPQKGPFGPRKALLGAPVGLGVPWGA